MTPSKIYLTDNPKVGAKSMGFLSFDRVKEAKVEMEMKESNNLLLCGQ